MLQRLLFSTFPHGRSGAGLLILRAVVGITALTQGVLYLPLSSGPRGASPGQWIFCLALIVSGAALVIGCLAPLAALVVGACFLLISFGWLPEPVGDPHHTRSVGLQIVISAVAAALLGPGALSVDAYLFGRREIVIPPPPSPPPS